MREGYVKARITWLTPEEGGRQLPIGSRYAGHAAFDGFDESHWSYFITNYDSPDFETHSHYVEMTLLVREMVEEILTPGRVFECYEGWRLVATGEVIA